MMYVKGGNGWVAGKNRITVRKHRFWPVADDVNRFRSSHFGWCAWLGVAVPLSTFLAQSLG